MGESYTMSIPGFNGSVRIESRPEKLTSEAGALPLREALNRLGMLGWLNARLDDPRNPKMITHPFIELVTTSLVLFAQGWRDQDDADDLRDDPVLRLAVSTRRGTSPLDGPPVSDDGAPVQDGVPHGLASQPTLSRLVRYLSTETNRRVLQKALLVGAGRRIRAMRGHRVRSVMLDVDSLPVEVHGHQPQSEYNGHYHTTIYHPLVASLGEYGDMVGLKLRRGKTHTANGARRFILRLVDQLEQEVCQIACVRIDAGFPSEALLSGLEQRRLPTPYVARIKNNAVLDRMAEPYLNVPPCPADAEPGIWFHDLEYRAGTWSRARRVVLIVQQRRGELFPHYFWLITSWAADEMPADDLLALYRGRGSCEKLMGEWMSTLEPALSSANRMKSHYRGEAVQKRGVPRDAFAANEVILPAQRPGLQRDARHPHRGRARHAEGLGPATSTRADPEGRRAGLGALPLCHSRCPARRSPALVRPVARPPAINAPPALDRLDVEPPHFGTSTASTRWGKGGRAPARRRSASLSPTETHIIRHAPTWASHH